MINTTLAKIEDQNKTKLHNVFKNIDYNSEAQLGQTKERNKRLKNLIDGFSDSKLDLDPEKIGKADIIGDVYEFNCSLCCECWKKAGEFYTPGEVSETLARLIAPQEGNRICDPTCGSGSY